MWQEKLSSPFTKSGLKKRYWQARALLTWRLYGFSDHVLAELLDLGLDPSDDKIGSSTFRFIWANTRAWSANRRLSFLLELVNMPRELSGDLQENKSLQDRFASDLAPHDPLFEEIAELVSEAFPHKTLAQSGDLQRRLHQFRYVLSEQQASYVRRHFKTAGMTDRDALATYLATLPKHRYSLTASSRLHNKRKVSDGSWAFPDKLESYNIKVLIDFHSEFILSSQGNFLNEVDSQQVTLTGIINGASFNYGEDGKRHWDLDVDPVKAHDPLFRSELTKSYRAPNRLRKKLFQKAPKGYENSLFNRQGHYASAYGSLSKELKKALKAFRKAIRSATKN